MLKFCTIQAVWIKIIQYKKESMNITKHPNITITNGHVNSRDKNSLCWLWDFITACENTTSLISDEWNQ